MTRQTQAEIIARRKAKRAQSIPNPRLVELMETLKLNPYRLQAAIADTGLKRVPTVNALYEIWRGYTANPTAYMMRDILAGLRLANEELENVVGDAAKEKLTLDWIWGRNEVEKPAHGGLAEVEEG